MTIDTIPLTRTVMFVGEWFSLITTIEVPTGATDDFIIQRAGKFMQTQYGWDVASVSLSQGVLSNDEEEK